MNRAYRELLEKFREIHYLEEIQEILHWDQETMMPPKGGKQRAEQLAVLESIIHKKLTDPKIGELLQELKGETDLPLEAKADIREAELQYTRATKIPNELAAEIAKVSTLSTQKWGQCRQDGDFSEFVPLLSQLLELKRQYADALRDGEDKSRYQVLLEEYEPGLSVEALEDLFRQLRESLPPLVDTLKEKTKNFYQIKGKFPKEPQEKFCLEIVEKMGYDLQAGRLDETIHPFCTGTGNDVRIATRYSETSLFESAILSTVHEAGHALYEQGIDPERLAHPAGKYASLGIHESQSRLWENFIGRSKPFWEFFLPRLKEYFPQLQDLTLQQLWESINRVQPSFIRTESDEVTYNLHIILRFEIEEKMIEGHLKAEELTDFWNAKFKDYFHLTPPDDMRGAFQDVHWPLGIFGYFPTYTLGNLYAAQFYRTLREDLPLEQLLSSGSLLEIREWLRDKIHRWGRLYLPGELCQRVTGKPLSVEPFLTYLKEKYGV